jgi:hypothetical protein
MPELVARIGKRDGLRTRCDGVAGENLDALRTFQEFGVDAQFLGQRFVEAQELRRSDP